MQHDNGRQQEQVGHYANAFVFYDVKNIFSNKRRRNENATEIFFKPFLCFVFNLIFGVFKANLIAFQICLVFLMTDQKMN